MDHTNKIYNLLSHAETELFGKAYITFFLSYNTRRERIL